MCFNVRYSHFVTVNKMYPCNKSKVFLVYLIVVCKTTLTTPCVRHCTYMFNKLDLKYPHYTQTQWRVCICICIFFMYVCNACSIRLHTWWRINAYKEIHAFDLIKMEIEPRVMCDVFGVRASRRLRSGGADGQNGYGTRYIFYFDL